MEIPSLVCETLFFYDAVVNKTITGLNGGQKYKILFVIGEVFSSYGGKAIF